MPQQDENLDTDFDSQLRGLFYEAEQQLEGKKAASRKAEAKVDAQVESDQEKEITRLVAERAARAYISVPQMLRPMVLGLEAVTRAAGENSSILNRLDKAADESAAALQDLPSLIDALQNLLDQKNGINQRMFDAMHEELKGYKDAFLLESVHKPIIRDLISLYDDMETIHHQVREAVSDAAGISPDSAGKLHGRLQAMNTNVLHNCEFIVEVLARLDVVPLQMNTGKLDKQTQRVIAVEIAEDPDDDGDIVRSVKRGFSWKGRVVRAEEVVIKKWKEGFLVALSADTSQK